MLPFSEACERNKHPILAVLRRTLDQPASVLEIGSGTGQHAVHFARELPHLRWQPTDRPEVLPGLRARVQAEGTPNLLAPIDLDAARGPWPSAGTQSVVYTANTLHIMGWSDVESLFAGIAQLLQPVADGRLIVYGPFKYRGAFTTDSNRQFDEMLRARDPASGIRDFEAVDALATRAGLRLCEDVAMPANNQLLLWRRVAQA